MSMEVKEVQSVSKARGPSPHHMWLLQIRQETFQHPEWGGILWQKENSGGDEVLCPLLLSPYRSICGILCITGLWLVQVVAGRWSWRMSNKLPGHMRNILLWGPSPNIALLCRYITSAGSPLVYTYLTTMGEIGQKWDLVVTFDWRVQLT